MDGAFNPDKAEIAVQRALLSAQQAVKGVQRVCETAVKQLQTSRPQYPRNIQIF
jgi:nucleotidyltransferase/DNA polymerase involved in DNA repair